MVSSTEPDFEFAQDDESEQFDPVDAQLVLAASDCGIDLFTKQGHEFLLYRSSDLKQTAAGTAAKAVDRGSVRVLFIRREDRRAYLDLIEQVLASKLEDASLPLDARAAAVYRTATNIIGDMIADPEQHLDIGRAQRVVERMTAFVGSDRGALLALVAAPQSDPYRITHAINCCIFSVGVAFRLGVTDPQQIQDLGLGCMLMDLGMSMVPRSIINKPGPLTEEEWTVVHRHPGYSNRICEKRGGLPELAEAVVMQHHERMDGSGYPHGLKDQEIQLFGRIASVTQKFDSLTSDRPFRARMSTYKALQTMKLEHASKIDQRIFQEFVLLFHDDPAARAIRN